MNKRSMKFDIVDLVALGVISIEDLNEFSEKLIMEVKWQLNRIESL